MSYQVEVDGTTLGYTKQTVPLAVYQQLQTDRDGAVALSLVLVVVSIAVLVALRERIMGAR